MNYLVSFFFILAFCSSYAQIKSESPKYDEIRKLLELTKTQESADLLVNQSIAYMKKQRSDIPVSYWDKIRKEMDYDAFLEKVVPVYDKHFTHAEIKELITFFKTSAGKKYTNKLPIINTEIYSIGNAYGKEVGKIIAEKMKRDGY